MMSRRTRYFLLGLMTMLTATCVFLFPHIRINGDMTEYLPSDSHMKEGLDTMRRHFPEVDMNAFVVKAMFKGKDFSDMADKLETYEGVSGLLSSDSRDNLYLYQLSVEKGASPKTIAATIEAAYGDSVVVETNANSNMPDNMVLVIIIAVVLVFGILFLMCNSFVEALLFILTIGMAVVINMGTNAFLPSVSMMTNTIVAVLQLVLSMDYSIILMNRFRQESARESDPVGAMSLAIRKASSSILSSSFTTIVGLLALVFMKFRIGLDLGVVLAKGVFCSLLSIYTILPALILMCLRGIKATEKKVFLIPTDRLASFEIKFRVPLAIIFLLVFFSSAYLSRRTELSYASIWESEINDCFPPQNLFSLVYRTEDEDKLISLVDSLSADSGVRMALSYPSLLKRPLEPGEMLSEVRRLTSMLPGSTAFQMDSTLLSEENLNILFYAASHPVRDEKMSFQDIINVGRKAASSGLVPAGMDVDAMVKEWIPVPEAPKTPEVRTAAEPEPETVPTKPDTVTVKADSVAVKADSVALEQQTQQPTLSVIKEVLQDKPESVPPDKLMDKYQFTKENCTGQLSSSELAEFLGFSRSQASIIFSMAGRKGRNGRMSPYEFICYMTDTVLHNRLLRKMINDEQAEGLAVIRKGMEDVLNREDAPVEALPEIPAAPVDTLVQKVPPVEVETEPEAKPQEPEVKHAEPADEDDPMAELALMYASGGKYSADAVWKALSGAGISGIDRNMVDLLFMYCGSLSASRTRMSIEELVTYLSTVVAGDPLFAAFIPDEQRRSLSNLDKMMSDGAGTLRKKDWSMAALVTDYPLESEKTFGFIEKVSGLCSDTLGDDQYLIGESVMYKEMKDGFRRELLILTLLTVISIFLIVAFTFRSILIPTILVMTVMSGVYVNVIFSGLGGNTMLYLAYLIVQSILMGATIDYGILFTNYYLDCRKAGMSVRSSMTDSYRGSIHTIMTSGLIIIFAPWIMSVLLPDPTIRSILSSLTYGAVAAITLILLVLPATLAATDRIITHRFRK